ncbi:MAG TPA: O-antigen ligase [Acidobacteriaceae bacterium]|nr:O-antigen ligase [Acidobacteriaceae bacterium]
MMLSLLHTRPPHKSTTIPLEDLICVLVFAFFAMQGAIPFIAPAQSLEMTGSAPTPLTTLGGIASQAVVNILILALLLRRPRYFIRRVADFPWILLPALLAILAIASAAWSLDPFITLRRSLPFALAGLFGFWFATRYSLVRQVAILRFAMLALSIATVLIVLFDPALGLDHSPGHAVDWQGIFTQKNACGRMMVLATATILCAPARTLLRPTHFATLGLFFFVLFMTGSRGAWMIETAVLVLFALFAFARHSGQRVRLILAATIPLAAIGLAAFGILDFRQLAPLFGRDPSLTGRTAIWAQVTHFIGERPCFGYGYDAFWRGMQGPSLQIAAAVHFIVAHAHNGFLEIALELGIAGLVLFALSWLRGWFALWSLWQRGAIARIAWPLAILILILLYDIDENTLLIYNGLFWVLYVSALVNIERARKSVWTRIQPLGDPHHTAPFAPHEILESDPRFAPDIAVPVQEIS